MAKFNKNTEKWSSEYDSDGEVATEIKSELYENLDANNKVKHDLIHSSDGIIKRINGTINERALRDESEEWLGSLHGDTSIDIRDFLEEDTETSSGTNPREIRLNHTVYLLGIEDDDGQRCLCSAYILGAQKQDETHKFLYVKFTDNAADPIPGERYYKIAMENIKSIKLAEEQGRGRKRNRKTKRRKNKRKRSTKKRKRL